MVIVFFGASLHFGPKENEAFLTCLPRTHLFPLHPAQNRITTVSLTLQECLGT